MCLSLKPWAHGNAYTAAGIRHARIPHTRTAHAPCTTHTHVNRAYTTCTTPFIHRITLNKRITSYKTQTRMYGAHAYTVLHTYRTRMHAYAAQRIYTTPRTQRTTRALHNTCAAPHAHSTTSALHHTFTPPRIQAPCMQRTMRAPHIATLCIHYTAQNATPPRVHHTTHIPHRALSASRIHHATQKSIRVHMS